MKKITTIVLLLIAVTTFAQKNLFEAMLEFDDQQYKHFRIHDNEDGFKITPVTNYLPTAIFTVIKNKYDRGVAITKYNEELKDNIVWYHKHTDEVDHYSQPAKIRIPTSTFYESFVMIDGILFELRETNKDLTRYDVNYSSVWIPVKTIEGDKEAKQAAKDADKKKGEFENDAKNPDEKKKFGSFMKDLADKAKAVVEAQMGGSVPTVLKQFKSGDEVRNKINSYIAAMKKKQGAYSAQEQKEMKHMQQILDDDNADIKKVNDDYWASPAGQARIKRMGNSSGSSSSNSFTLQNDTDHLVSVIYNGYSKNISSGSSTDWDCGKPVHYKVLQSGTSSAYVAGGLISSGEGVCGKTVTIR